MTHLTERQAWLVIAKAYATEWENRTKSQQQITKFGCCSAARLLAQHRKISWTQESKMHNKILDCLPERRICAPDGTPNYFCSIRPSKNDLLRADFCYLMAYACEDE